MVTRRFRTTLIIALLLAFSLLCVWVLSISESSLALKSQWRLGVDNTHNNQNWQPGKNVNIGQTDKQLFFNLSFTYPESEQFIVVSPTFLDLVEVVFFNAHGDTIATVVKGDKTLDMSLDHSYDIGRLAFPVPAKAISAHIKIDTTENLQANVNLLSKEQLVQQNYLNLIFKSSILMLITIAALGGFITCWWTGQILYGAFAVHQMVWFFLLLELSNFVPSLVPSAVYMNGWMLGATNILTTVTGSAFHWQLLRQLVKAPWLNSAFFITIFVSVINLFIYLFINQSLSLVSNAITLVLATTAFIIAIPLTPAINFRQGFILRKIKWVYAVLMSFVVLSALSRLGFGDGSMLSLIYVFALITTLLLGYILLIRLTVQNRQKTKAITRAHALAATNNQLNKHVEEQSALLSMLSHEIKTPLTTLKLLIFRSPIREQLSYQLRSIENVVDTVALMDHIQSDFISEETFDLVTLVQEQWLLFANHSEQDKQLRFDNTPVNLVNGNRLALEVIAKNLLSNAQKYGVGTCIQLHFYETNDEVILQVENLCDGLDDIDSDLLIKKYYRANKVSNLRGTGLGLWITKTLCEANDYVFSIDIKDRLFTASVRIKL